MSGIEGFFCLAGKPRPGGDSRHPDMKRKNPHELVFSSLDGETEDRLLRDLGQGAEGLGGDAHSHAANRLGLKIHSKSPASMALGMAHFVSCLGTSASHVANAAHKCEKSCLVTRDRLSWKRFSGKRNTLYDQ